MLGLWVLVEEMLRQQIAIIAGSLVDGAMLPWLSKGGQTLYHQPCRIVSIFDGQLLLVSTLWEELREVDGFHACFMLSEGHCLGDILTVG